MSLEVVLLFGYTIRVGVSYAYFILGGITMARSKQTGDLTAREKAAKALDKAMANYKRYPDEAAGAAMMKAAQEYRQSFTAQLTNGHS